MSTLEGAGGGHRIRFHALVAGGRRFSVAGLYPLAEVESTLAGIRRLVLVAIPILILLAGAGGWFLAGVAPGRG